MEESGENKMDELGENKMEERGRNRVEEAKTMHWQTKVRPKKRIICLNKKKLEKSIKLKV